MTRYDIVFNTSIAKSGGAIYHFGGGVNFPAGKYILRLIGWGNVNATNCPWNWPTCFTPLYRDFPLVNNGTSGCSSSPLSQCSFFNLVLAGAYHKIDEFLVADIGSASNSPSDTYDGIDVVSHPGGTIGIAYYDPGDYNDNDANAVARLYDATETATYIGNVTFITVPSTSSTVDISIDGGPLSSYTGPEFTISGLSSGVHTYEAHITGYDVIKGSFDIISTEPTFVYLKLISLESGAGTVLFNIMPIPGLTDTVTLTIGSNTYPPYTTSPLIKSGLSPGSYNYTITRSGYNSTIGTFDIIAGQTTVIDIIMTSLSVNGAVEFNVHPSSFPINVILDSGSPIPYNTSVINILNLSVGSHSYTIYSSGYSIVTGTFNIYGGQTTHIDVTLVPSLPCSAAIKYEGDSIILNSTPSGGIGPYYVVFRKKDVDIDPLRLGGQSNPIYNAPEDVQITRTYVLDNDDIRFATNGRINFSVYIEDSCPTGTKTCSEVCFVSIGCNTPICSFTVT